jgi:hypothetical protein
MILLNALSRLLKRDKNAATIAARMPDFITEIVASIGAKLLGGWG